MQVIKGPFPSTTTDCMTRIVPRLELGGSPPRSDVSDPAVSARPAAAWCADRGAEKVDGAVERIKKKFNIELA